ncbi:MAG: response regulator [Myxococcales bacterium]|nr:response regulator [Myxococcales bacterium]
MAPPPTEAEQRVLVCAVVGRDAALAREVLGQADIVAVACDGLAALVREMVQGAAALLLAEEALADDGAHLLVSALASQPPWSDLPIIVAASQDPSVFGAQRTRARVESLGNVTLLDRPLRVITLVSAARTALRVRRRQYEMRALFEQLHDGVRQRDRFLAMLAHELRNPLAALLYAEARLKDDPDQQRPREIIARQTRHLTRMVDDLLDVARVTTGKVTLQRGPLDVREILERVVATARADPKRVHLTLDVPDAELVVDGDAMRIEQVATNLIRNAMKYTPHGGQVRVRAERDGARARIAVEDDGVGIAPEMLPHVFDLFVQADRTLDRADGGLGIGLTVVRGIVEQHGGEVQARSEGLGRGSSFLVWLPLDPSCQVDSEPQSRTGAASEPATRRVLVIEDEPDAREILCLILKEAGHEVHAASTGMEGVTLAGEIEPDVALVDIGLPELDGYDVARALRRQLGSRIFLAAITGYGQRADRERAIDAGFDTHMTKPVEVEKVERLVRQAPRRRPAGRAQQQAAARPPGGGAR